MAGASPRSGAPVSESSSSLTGTTSPGVIATGGGIVTEPDTFATLLRNCHCIWLQATPEEHMSRVVAQGDMRPMLKNREAMSDLKSILEARAPLYERAAAVFDTSNLDEDAAARSLAAVARGVLG